MKENTVVTLITFVCAMISFVLSMYLKNGSLIVAGWVFVVLEWYASKGD